MWLDFDHTVDKPSKGKVIDVFPKILGKRSMVFDWIFLQNNFLVGDILFSPAVIPCLW